MSNARKARGMRTQLLVTKYLRDRGWPHAESAGAGRSGTDVLGTIDIAVEVKARSDLNPLAWVRQAEQAADGRLPMAVFRCNGQGEDAGRYLTLLRFEDAVNLLRAAGYGDEAIERQIKADESARVPFLGHQFRHPGLGNGTGCAFMIDEGVLCGESADHRMHVSPQEGAAS